MDTIMFYGATWCADCRRVKSFLDSKSIPYNFLNIDTDDAAAAQVEKINNGLKRIPILIFPEGRILVEPSTEDLEKECGK